MMHVGTIVRYGDGSEERIRRAFENLLSIDIHSCQITAWQMDALTEENARRLRALAEEYGVEISAFWCGWSGDKKWNFTEGPQTLGLAPRASRRRRTKELLRGVEFTRILGVSDMATHVGFIPFNASGEEYRGLVKSIRAIGNRCAEYGIRFLFETGQETPITLLRLIRDTGCDNLGINLDPANLMMYGMANPTDAARLFGPLIHGVHAKDGSYPSPDDPTVLGKEKPLGQGDVNYPKLIAILKENGYDGALTIEREIKGEEQKRDILAAKATLEELIRA